MAQFEERNNSLITIFMLLYANKLPLDKNTNSLKINKKILSQIVALNDFVSLTDISSIEDLYSLIEGIKKMENEK